MGIFQTGWTSTSEHPRGTTVTFSGVAYQALNDIPINTAAIPFDNPNWKPLHIIAVSDIYGIIEAIRLELNATKNNTTNNSINHLISLAHNSFKRTIRVPEMLDTRFTMVDADGNIKVPSGCLEPLRLNVMSDTKANYAISIKRADPSEFRRQELGIDDTAAFAQANMYDGNPFVEYVYLPNRDEYKIRPVLAEGTEIEVYGYFEEPTLGTRIDWIDNHGRELNSDRQTVTEWEAAGNSPENFVQATIDITTNWFSQAAPDLIIYGALLHAEAWIKDESKIQVWAALFEKAKQEIEMLVDSHDAGAEEYITQSNGSYQS